MENLHLFLTKIRELTFWQRLFNWNSIRNLSYDAFEEFKSCQKELIIKKDGFDLMEKKFLHAHTINEILQNNLHQLEKTADQKDNVIRMLDQKIDDLNSTVSKINLANSKYETTGEHRRKSYEDSIIQLNQLKETLENEIERLSDERVSEQKDLTVKMKRQWSEHETSVKQTLKIICQNHFIKYVDSVPFRGSPD
ncbi:MAG: hypothetical protein ABIN25_13595, partial [Ginsengibacter sp.]